jgi:hypothetical protein
MTKATKKNRKIDKALDMGARTRKRKVQSAVSKGGKTWKPWNPFKVVKKRK